MSNLHQEYLQHSINGQKEKTVGEILDTLNEEQRNVVNYLIWKALNTKTEEIKESPEKKG